MSSIDREPSPPESLGPDPGPERKTGMFERYEWVFIAFFLLLIGLGSFQRWKTNRSDFQPLTIERGEDSEALGVVDWDQPLEAQPVDSKDLNRATRNDLLALPGIGPALADGILGARERKGTFRSFEELDDVPGIGPSRLKTLRPFLFVTGEVAGPAPATPTSEIRPPLLAVGPNHLAEADQGSADPVKSDLNSMTLEQLQTIPGIGSAFASKILEKREQLGKFQSWDQVREIQGIGPKRLENLRNHAKLR